MLIIMSKGIHKSDTVKLAPSFADRLAVYKFFDGETCVYQLFVLKAKESTINRLASHYRQWDVKTRFELVADNINESIVKEFRPFKEEILTK